MQDRWERQCILFDLRVAVDFLLLNRNQTFDERKLIIRFIRETLDEAGLVSTPIVAGVGGSSTRETIKLANDAAEAGAYVRHSTRYQLLIQ